jgi:hypothetical protein
LCKDAGHKAAVRDCGESSVKAGRKGLTLPDQLRVAGLRIEPVVSALCHLTAN